MAKRLLLMRLEVKARKLQKKAQNKTNLDGHDACWKPTPPRMCEPPLSPNTTWDATFWPRMWCGSGDEKRRFPEISEINKLLPSGAKRQKESAKKNIESMLL